MAEPSAAAPAGVAAPERDILLATKLHVPRPRPGFVARPRLLEALGEGLARRLILVCAPAGFGKTALLADWAYMVAVIEAAGNLVFQLIMNSVRELYLPNASSFAMVVAGRAELAPLYSLAAKAIRDREPEEAAAAIGALAGAQEARMVGRK